MIISCKVRDLETDMWNYPLILLIIVAFEPVIYDFIIKFKFYEFLSFKIDLYEYALSYFLR